MHEILDSLPIAGIGAGTALLTALGKSGRFRLPRIIRQADPDGGAVTLVDLGFLASPILGAVVAVMGDGGWRTALVWGVLSGGIGPAVLNTLLDPLLHKLGLPELSDPDGEGTRAPSEAPSP